MTFQKVCKPLIWSLCTYWFAIFMQESNKKEKPIKQLATKYKIDFVRKMVVVNGKWAQLPENYDIENKSYTQMVIDIKKS